MRPARARRTSTSSRQASATRRRHRGAGQRAARLVEADERNRAGREQRRQSEAAHPRRRRVHDEPERDAAPGRLAELVAGLEPPGRPPARRRRGVVRHQPLGRERAEGGGHVVNSVSAESIGAGGPGQRDGDHRQQADRDRRNRDQVPGLARQRVVADRRPQELPSAADERHADDAGDGRHVETRAAAPGTRAPLRETRSPGPSGK